VLLTITVRTSLPPSTEAARTWLTREGRREGNYDRRFTIASCNRKGLNSSSARIHRVRSLYGHARLRSTTGHKRILTTHERAAERRGPRRSNFRSYTSTSTFPIFIASRIIKENEHRVLMRSRVMARLRPNFRLHLSLHKYIIYSFPQAPNKRRSVENRRNP